MVQFETFNLPEPVLRAIKDMGFTDASPIQGAAIPTLLLGRDIIGQAQTGTGKTAAFGIPLVIAAMNNKPSLVLVPTRELAQQVVAEIDRIGKHAGIRGLALYGGASFGEQARALDRGEADILVATPGRLRDHIERGTLKPSVAKLIVLDEADEMLKMGFIDEVEEILKAVGSDRQTMLFSATMPEPIVRLAEHHLKDPEFISAADEGASIATANTEQFAVFVDSREKLDVLMRILAVERPTGALIFRHTRETVDELVSGLRHRGIRAASLHGGMAQGERESVLANLRDGTIKIVVATNVAARGLDVDTISHVFNYDTPRETEAYVHRIGRTGRAGRDGKSFLFVTNADRGKLRGIERLIGTQLAWREIPSDAEVEASVRSHAAKWIATLAAKANVDSMTTIEEAIEAGADPRALAAGLLSIVARQEGLAMPQLEPRRQRHGHPAPRSHGDRGHSPSRSNERNYDQNSARVALTISVGRDAGVRPGDLVGALTNEGGLVGADIGRIDILPRFSVVEVPEGALASLFSNMERATIRGQRADMRVANRWEFRAPAR